MTKTIKQRLEGMKEPYPEKHIMRKGYNMAIEEIIPLLEEWESEIIEKCKNKLAYELQNYEDVEHLLSILEELYEQ